MLGLDLDPVAVARQQVLAELLYGRLAKVVPVAAPAAGQDWSVTVPGGVIWRPLTITATYTASAVAGNRNVAATLSDGVNIYMRLSLYQAISTGQNWALCWARLSGDHAGANTIAGVQLSLPDVPWLPGSTFSTVTGGKDAGDTWTAIVLYVIELELTEIGAQADWLARRV